MAENHGFEFSHMGIVPLGTPYMAVSSDPIPGGLALDRAFAAPPVSAPAQSAPAAPATAQTASSPAQQGPLKGAQLKQMAKARIKEIDKILRAMPALQEERAELSGLLAAMDAAKRATRRTSGAH